MTDHQQRVEWFRSSAPYINAHRGRILVIQFGGEAAVAPDFAELIHDFGLLLSLGVKLVLVHGARPQIEGVLREKDLPIEYVDGIRITAESALPSVRQAVGAVRLEVEALLSMGLANSPMAGSRIRVATGNFIVARPLGVRAGVDFQHAGEVRRVDTEAIRDNLEDGAIVLVSPLGYSPTGEVFNLRAEDVATAVATELRASKLVFLCEGPGLFGEARMGLAELILDEAKTALATMRRLGTLDEGGVGHLLANAVHACRNGVSRTHLLDRRLPGALLLELYTRDGVGTMVSADQYDATRRATIDDVGGILELIEPLERTGALVRRSREKLEGEIDRFIVMERDGAIIACAAAYHDPHNAVVELACLAVHPDYRSGLRGDALLEAVEREAASRKMKTLFVLTTRAVHWFKERGFVDATLDNLPVERRELYNYERRSKVLVKALD